MNTNYSGPKIDIIPEDLDKFEENEWGFEPKIDGIWVSIGE